jgi:hypothetical protein
MKEVGIITLSELNDMAASMYGTLVKAVVDVERDMLVVDSELHVDQEQFLLEQGSIPPGPFHSRRSIDRNLFHAICHSCPT